MIKSDSHVIIRKKEYMKLVHLEKNKQIRIGAKTIDLTNIIGRPFFTIFEVVPQLNNKVFTLKEITKSCTTNPQERLNFDNFRVSNPSETVYKMVSDSKTFSKKTEFSQAKYLNKKDQKYFNYIQIFKPTVRQINEIFFEQRKSKIICLRNDNLSQIFEFADIEASGKYLVYDKGSNGLIVAGILKQLSGGSLIHLFSGQYYDRTSFSALEFDKDSLLNINVQMLFEHASNNFKCDCCLKNNHNLSIYRILQNSDLDAIIVATRENPKEIVERLSGFLKNGKPLLVFGLIKEPLEQLFIELKKNLSFINVHIINTILRYQQILSDRTHPFNKMTNGGFLLVGYKVSRI